MVTKHRHLENLIYLSKDLDVEINRYIKELKVELQQLHKSGHNVVKIETKLKNLTNDLRKVIAIGLHKF